MMAPLSLPTARRPALAALGAACALALLLSGCGKSGTEAAAAPAEPAPPVIQSGQLRFPSGHPQLALLGTVEARAAKDVAVDLPARLVWNEERTQRIYPAFAGRITSIQADLGQPVKAGAPLALLASPDFGQAQADTAKAHAGQSLAQQSLKRQRELFEAGIIARKDLEQAEADAAGAQAEVARAAARTRLYGSASGVNQQLSLSSGIGGVVVERNLNPGQEVRPDQSGPALFVVTDPTSLWVQIDARESDLSSLRPGDPITLQVPAYPGATFTGKVTATADAIDPGTRTIKVRGVVPNPDRRLKAEMLATARVQESRAGGVVVPASAIVLDGTQHVVYVRREPGVFEPRKVELAQEGPAEVIVASGLQPGDAVVNQNALLLSRQFQSMTEDAAAAKKAAP